jgi:hypothetical protein
MSKGYMIFVEGGSAPLVVHDDFAAAQKVAVMHAHQNRGKEVMLLQIHKRLLKPLKAEAETAPEKLPTHLPSRDEANAKRKLGLRDLVFKEQATPRGHGDAA